MHNSRRDFLKVSAGVASVGALPRLGAQEPGSIPGSIKGWLTYGEQRFAPATVAGWRAAGGSSGPAIHLDASSPKQEILGFGAAFTDASCYLFSQLSAEARAQVFAEFFGKSGLNLSVCRTCVGASDYSRNVYSFDESPTPDPTLSRFTIEHDRAYILPALREARKVNPELFLLSTPWSPPGWMKANGSMLGGSMRKEYFAPYAQYFVKFLRAYAQEGVKVDAVSVQNELDADQNGAMPACIWGQEYEVDFVKLHLGPAFQKAGIDTRIWIIDHNYNLWGRAVDELEDRDVWKYVDGVAWHGYVGEPASMSRVKEAFPDKHMYWTEGGPMYTEPDYLTGWAKWSETYTGILRNWARCIIGWNLALDEHGKPNIGPFECGGVITINSKTKELSRSGQYWAFAHYSKLVQRGARVIASEGEVEGVSHVAFQNADGGHVAVLTNTGGRRNVPLRYGNQATEVTLPASSVLTMSW